MLEKMKNIDTTGTNFESWKDFPMQFIVTAHLVDITSQFIKVFLTNQMEYEELDEQLRTSISTIIEKLKSETLTGAFRCKIIGVLTILIHYGELMHKINNN